MPVRANKGSFSRNKIGHGKLTKAVVSRYRSALVHATVHTRERWQQYWKKLVNDSYLM